MDNSESADTEAIRESMIWVVTFHVILFLVALLIIIFIVPLFGVRYKDFGMSLPGPTQFFLDLSNIFKTYLILLLPLAAGCFWLDAIIYSKLYEHKGRKFALLWCWAVAVALLVLTLAGLLSMWLPEIMWR